MLRARQDLSTSGASTLSASPQHLAKHLLDSDDIGQLLWRQESKESNTAIVALESMVSAGEHGVGLSTIMHETIDLLSHSGKGSATRNIWSGIIKVLWTKDWKPESSNDEDTWTSANFQQDPRLRAMAVSKITGGLEFDELSTREAAVSKADLDTCTWIFSQPPDDQQEEVSTWDSFPDWLERHQDPTYWITGKPGSGKSTVMKFILQSPLLRDHLSNWAGSTPIVLVSFYAWIAGSSLQKSFQGLKRTILLQTLQQHPELIPLVTPRRWALVRIIREATHFPTFPHWEDWEVDEAFDYLLSECGKSIRVAMFVDGLDEFDAPPKDVVSLIDSIISQTRDSDDGIKICISSRPWIEFQDAYHDIPKLQMDLHTGKDMAIFLRHRFADCRALVELARFHPEDTARLRVTMQQKANGVFIWLKLVGDSLVEAATEGAGIRELQDMLDRLPADIAALYDAIWSRIPAKSRSLGARYILMLLAGDDSLWKWEAFFLSDTVNHLPLRDTEDAQGLWSKLRNLNDEPLRALNSDSEASQRLMKRRLMARTRGILEPVQEVYVVFTHRTASDWAKGIENQNRLFREARGDEASTPYDVHFHLFRVYSLLFLKSRTQPLTDFDNETVFRLGQALKHASLVHLDLKQGERILGEIGQVLGMLNTDDAAADAGSPIASNQVLPALESGFGRSSELLSLSQMTTSPLHVASFLARDDWLHQVAVAKGSRGLLLRVGGHKVGLLECCIWGPNPQLEGHCFSQCAAHQDRPPMMHKRRLETVRLLLSHGVRQSHFNGPSGKVSLNREVQNADFTARMQDKDKEDREYWTGVVQLLGPTSRRSRTDSVWERVKSGLVAKIGL